MCELPETTTQALVTHIAAHNLEVKTEQEATQYLATLATVTISSRTKLLNYTTMVQHFLGTLQLPMAVYMLDYYLPMLSPNEGYNETGLTMQSAGPVRQPSQPIALEFLFKGSEFGHWRVKGGQDAFAFRHPSLGKTDVFSLLASDAHHHKVSPIGTGRLIAMVGTAEAPADDGDDLQILFGLVLAITPRAAKKRMSWLPHVYTDNVTLNSLRLPSSQYQPLSFLQRNNLKPSKTGILILTNAWTLLMQPSRDKKVRFQRLSFSTQCGCLDVPSPPASLPLSRKPPRAGTTSWD